MPLHLVRHAKAGKRGAWDGPDAERPLSASGRRQAEGLADRLGDQPVPRLLSSPAVRCRQTLEPLARRVGGKVEDEPALAEGSPFEAVLELLEALPDGSVLCSHGDLIPDVVQALVRRGLEVHGAPDWRKGATWVLERDGDARLVRGHAVAPAGSDPEG